MNATPQQEPACAPIDPRELRQVLGAFVTGVTVVTTVDTDGRPHGLTANSFNSVSLDPPLVLWSQGANAGSHAVFSAAEHFAVNILADDQIAVSQRFARAGADKFGPTATHAGLGGVPVLDGCTASLECRRVAAHPAGDHVIFIGQVLRMQRSARRPLAFGGGRYLLAHRHDYAGLTADEAELNRHRLQAVRLVTHEAEELAERLDQTIGVGVWGNLGPTIVHWVLASQPVTVNLRVGAVLPLLGSATGMAFAAWLPRETTIAATTAEALDAVQTPLGETRAAGMAVSRNLANFVDRAAVEVHAVSAPVFDASGRMLAALTALGTRESLDVGADAPVPRTLRDCAQALSRRLTREQP